MARPSLPIDKISIDGPRVRGNRSFISLLNNTCFSIRSRPGSGASLLIKMGMQKIRDEQPELFSRVVKTTARELGVSEKDVLDIVNG